MLPFEVPRLTTDSPVRVFPGIWKLLSFLRLPSQDGSPSLPLLSLFLSFIFCPTSFLRQWVAFLGAWYSLPALRSCFVEFTQRSNVLWWICWGESDLPILFLCHLRTAPPPTSSRILIFCTCHFWGSSSFFSLIRLVSSVWKSLQCLIFALTWGHESGYLFGLSCSVVLCRMRDTANKCHWHVWGALTVDWPHRGCHSSRRCTPPRSKLLRLTGVPWGNSPRCVPCVSLGELVSGYDTPGNEPSRIPGIHGWWLEDCS